MLKYVSVCVLRSFICLGKKRETLKSLKQASSKWKEPKVHDFITNTKYIFFYLDNIIFLAQSMSTIKIIHTVCVCISLFFRAQSPSQFFFFFCSALSHVFFSSVLLLHLVVDLDCARCIVINLILWMHCMAVSIISPFLVCSQCVCVVVVFFYFILVKLQQK